MLVMLGPWMSPRLTWPLSFSFFLAPLTCYSHSVLVVAALGYVLDPLFHTPSAGNLGTGKQNFLSLLPVSLLLATDTPYPLPP